MDLGGGLWVKDILPQSLEAFMRGNEERGEQTEGSWIWGVFISAESRQAEPHWFLGT